MILPILVTSSRFAAAPRGIRDPLQVTIKSQTLKQEGLVHWCAKLFNFDQIDAPQNKGFPRVDPGLILGCCKILQNKLNIEVI